MELQYPIPEETSIYFSKSDTFFGFVGVIGVFFVGLYIAFSTEQYVGGFAISLFGIFLSYFLFKRSKIKAPQLTINKLGIMTSKAGFYPWEEIGNEIVTWEVKNRSTHECLEYDCPTGHEEFDIGGLNVTGDQLAYIINVYRQRSEKKYKYDKNLLGLIKPMM
jgi:hypothetical protein